VPTSYRHISESQVKNVTILRKIQKSVRIKENAALMKCRMSHMCPKELLDK